MYVRNHFSSADMNIFLTDISVHTLVTALDSHQHLPTFPATELVFFYCGAFPRKMLLELLYIPN